MYTATNMMSLQEIANTFKPSVMYIYASFRFAILSLFCFYPYAQVILVSSSYA
jgi:hypothetical protein